jgi:peptidyl-prolyl cis-trans isomerase C
MPETDKPLTELDQALQTLRLDMNNSKSQSKYYDIFLNTTFCVPTLDPQELDGASAVEDDQALPLIIESEGNDYLMLFDTEERLKNWAAADATWVGVPGFLLAATTMPPLHWALNVGTEYAKQFHPDEITWLRDVVERCDDAAAAQELTPLSPPLTGGKP